VARHDEAHCGTTGGVVRGVAPAGAATTGPAKARQRPGRPLQACRAHAPNGSRHGYAPCAVPATATACRLAASGAAPQHKRTHGCPHAQAVRLSQPAEARRKRHAHTHTHTRTRTHAHAHAHAHALIRIVLVHAARHGKGPWAMRARRRWGRPGPARRPSPATQPAGTTHHATHSTQHAAHNTPHAARNTPRRTARLLARGLPPPTTHQPPAGAASAASPPRLGHNCPCGSSAAVHTNLCRSRPHVVRPAEPAVCPACGKLILSCSLPSTTDTVERPPSQC
jgi:hypothetical protein